MLCLSRTIVVSVSGRLMAAIFSSVIADCLSISAFWKLLASRLPWQIGCCFSAVLSVLGEALDPLALLF